MNGNVKTHKLDECRVFTKAKKRSQIPGVILAGVNSRELALSIDIAEDATSNVGELGNQIHSIFEGGLPVLLLGDTLLVGLGKRRVVVELK